MIVLGLLLLIAVVAVIVFILYTAVDQQVRLTADWLNLDWRPSVLLVFLLGAACLLLAEIALALMRSGTKRTAHRRRELKRLRDAEKQRGVHGGGAQGTSTGQHGTPDAGRRDTRQAPTAPGDPDPGSGSQAPRDAGTPHTRDADTSARSGWHDDPQEHRRGSSPAG